MSVRYVVSDQNSGIFVENKFSFKALKKTNNIVPAPNIYLQSKKGRINTTRNRELEDRINRARNREKNGINSARNSKKEGETRRQRLQRLQRNSAFKLPRGFSQLTFESGFSKALDCSFIHFRVIPLCHLPQFQTSEAWPVTWKSMSSQTRSCLAADEKPASRPAASLRILSLAHFSERASIPRANAPSSLSGLWAAASESRRRRRRHRRRQRRGRRRL